MRGWLALGLAMASRLTAQPVVDQVLHGATLRAPQFAFSGIAQGSLAVAKGTGLGPSTLQQGSSYPLQKTLAGTSVSITVGGVVSDALMVYASDRQIAFVVPSTTPLGAAQVRVTYNGRTSAPASAAIVARNPGVYTWGQDGNGSGIATDAITGALITVQSPARPGQVLAIWGNGLGAISGDDAQPPAATDLGGDLTASIGGRAALISYRGRSGCCSGLDQINLVAPTGVPDGCYVPLYFEGAGGAITSNVTTIPVTSDGKPCPDPLGIPGLSVSGKDRVTTGMLLLERSGFGDFAHHTYVTTSQTYYNAAGLGNHLGTVTPGTCIVAQSDDNNFYDPLHQVLADAGTAVTLTLGSNAFRFPRDDLGGYGAFIQGRSPLDFSGSGTISNGAGAQVPAFSLAHTTPALANFQWSGPASFAAGDALKITWDGAAPDGFVYVSANNSAGPLRMSLTCRVSGAQSAFTVPGNITRFLPAGAADLTVIYRQPIPLSGFPSGFDGMRYERQVVGSKSVAVR